MYICVCTAVTERDIAEKIQAGVTTFEALQFETGVATCCGQCAEYAREHLAQVCANPCAGVDNACRQHVSVSTLIPLARAA